MKLQWKKYLILLGGILGVFLLNMGVYASDLYTTRVINDKVVLYAGNTTGIQEIDCTIGQSKVSEVTGQDIKGSDIRIETYMLIDNSLSVNSEYRETIKEIMLQIVDQKASNEVITLATFDTELHYLIAQSDDISTTKNLLSGIQYQDLETRLKDVLFDLYQDLEEKDDTGVFRRIIISSDGMESNGVGVSSDEMIAMVKEAGWPVSIVGIEYKDHTAELENMFRIARETKGKYYYLAESKDVTEIADGINSVLDTSRILVTVPNSMGDGSVKGMKLNLTSNEGNSVLELNQQMPFLEAETPETTLITEKQTEKITEAPAPVETEVLTEAFTEAAMVAVAEPTTEAAVEVQSELVTDFLEETETETETETEAEDDDEEKSFGDILLMIGMISGSILLIVIIILLIVFLLKKKKHRKNNDTEMDGTELTGEETIAFGDTQDLHDDLTVSLDETVHPVIRLYDLSGTTAKETVTLNGKKIIGRSKSEAQISYPDIQGLSRKHCILYARDNRVFVQDLNSTNHTYVDGSMLYQDEEKELFDDSILKLGKLELRVEFCRQSYE